MDQARVARVSEFDGERSLANEEFLAAVDRSAGRVFAFLRVFTGQAGEAEDVMQETIERAYRAWQRGRGPRGEPLPWLLLIARRICIDRARRDRLRKLVPFRLEQRAPDLTMAESEERIWFGQLAAVLTTRQYEAIVLRYLCDLDDQALARVLVISPSGARTLVSRAVASLRARPELFA